MHSKQRLIEQRLARALNERIRPAVHARSVPVEVAIWNSAVSRSPWLTVWPRRTSR